MSNTDYKSNTEFNWLATYWGFFLALTLVTMT